ncbi:MAG: translation initiation factor IF-2 [Candidatus Nealsonbacteria bacterium]
MVKTNKNLINRPPVVVVLGHIDSGKTTLLDQVRKTKVAEKESGGITQHIGAYQIEKQGKKITFIDTPGHEAFSQMRSRGAKIADIAILVIDSCKGVEKQTEEVISHIKEAKVPPIVAFNKTDRPEANPEKGKRELQKEGISVESLGGKVPSVEISAKTGQGVEDLLDLILLVAEMENLKADILKKATGVIIESYLDSQRGPTATLILNEGVLRLGDAIATLSVFGKVKSLEDFQGKQIFEVFPADPAVFLGLEDVPKVGENIMVFSNLEEAKSYIQPSLKEKVIQERFELKPEQKVLNLILKTDVLGSIEAVNEVLKKLPQEKIVLRILKSDVGDINENDVKLAKSSKALILGFRVKINPVAKKLLQREETKVDVMNFDIIYDLVERVRKFMEKTLEYKTIRTDIGKMKVLVTFWSKKNRQIVGGRIIEGETKRGTLIEVLRDEELIDRGKMINLQRNKKDVESVAKGEEAGILYEGNKKIEKGDTLIFYTKEKKKMEL